MRDEDLEIIPGERIGPYYLKWDIETLKKHLPANYVFYDDLYTWGLEFEDYLIQVRKIDNRIDSITVKNKFKHHFKHKITCNSTLGQLEDDFGITEDRGDANILPAYPGMEFYFEDEDENDESDDSWRPIKIEAIVIYDPSFIWDEHFSFKDYDKMEANQFECPFPKDKLVESVDD